MREHIVFLHTLNNWLTGKSSKTVSRNFLPPFALFSQHWVSEFTQDEIKISFLFPARDWLYCCITLSIVLYNICISYSSHPRSVGRLALSSSDLRSTEAAANTGPEHQHTRMHKCMCTFATLNTPREAKVWVCVYSWKQFLIHKQRPQKASGDI